MFARSTVAPAASGWSIELSIDNRNCGSPKLAIHNKFFNQGQVEPVIILQNLTTIINVVVMFHPTTTFTVY